MVKSVRVGAFESVPTEIVDEGWREQPVDDDAGVLRPTVAQYRERAKLIRMKAAAMESGLRRQELLDIATQYEENLRQHRSVAIARKRLILRLRPAPATDSARSTPLTTSGSSGGLRATDQVSESGRKPDTIQGTRRMAAAKRAIFVINESAGADGVFANDGDPKT